MTLPSHLPSTRIKQTTYSFSLINSNILLYCLKLIRAPGLSVPASLMRPRPAVLQTPSESSILSRLPVYKSCPPPTHSKSTLLQLLIPLHFNSRTINTYKKPREGVPPLQPQSFATCHYARIAKLDTQERPQPHSPHALPHSFRHPSGVPPVQIPSKINSCPEARNC